MQFILQIASIYEGFSASMDAKARSTSEALSFWLCRYAAEASASEEEPLDEAEMEESSSGEDEGSSARKAARKGGRGSGPTGRTRRNILPRIMRGQRCGHCHTCLNPQVLYILVQIPCPFVFPPEPSIEGIQGLLHATMYACDSLRIGRSLADPCTPLSSQKSTFSQLCFKFC